MSGPLFGSTSVTSTTAPPPPPLLPLLQPAALAAVTAPTSTHIIVPSRVMVAIVVRSFVRRLPVRRSTCALGAPLAPERI
jgi:hypothetical protein